MAQTTELTKDFKPGKYVFQLINKINPRTPDSPPYQPKKGLPGKIEVYDETTESLRLIRVVPGYPTIWVDEQIEKKIDDKRADENAWSPEFSFGSLELTYPQDKLKIERMLLDDKYDGKKQKAVVGGLSIYTMVDANANALSTISRMKLSKEAEDMAWEASKDFASIEYHAKFLGIKYMDGSRKKENEEIIAEYVNKAKADPELFKKTFSSPTIKVKAAIQKAIDSALIDVTSIRGEASWADTKAYICKINLEKDPADSILEFSTSGKAGDQFLQALKELLKK